MHDPVLGRELDRGSRTDRSGSGTDPPLGRIERVAQPVADEVDAEGDQDDHEPRERDEPPELEALALALVDEDAERRGRRLDAESEEREGGPVRIAAATIRVALTMIGPTAFGSM